MSETMREHKSRGPHVVACAVVTVSDTRTEKTDRGGQIAVDMLSAAGHQIVDREIVPDEPQRLAMAIERVAPRCDAVLLTGGTGASRRDQTVETVQRLLTKTIPGYGELFRMLSYAEIGPAAMLSRVVGGLRDETVLLTMPGSPAAVRLAMEKLILPELAHLVYEARR